MERTYFRMSKIGAALPTHWAYGDASEGVSEGAQVLTAHQTALAAIGADIDGTYSPEEGYTKIIVIKTSEDPMDAGWSFRAVLREDVEWTGIVDAVVFAEWVNAQAAAEDEDPEDWATWADEDEIEEWLLNAAAQVDVEWIDTLKGKR